MSILHFSLRGILEQQQILALDTKTGLVVLLSVQNNLPQLESDVALAPGELALFSPLLEAYPYFCPHEVLLASITGRATEQEIINARERLQEASLGGIWDVEMRPVRSILSRIRLKTRIFRFDIRAILETGYILDRMK